MVQDEGTSLHSCSIPASFLSMSLRGLREGASMTQEDLAFALNVSRRTIINWEQGRSEPPPSVVRRLTWLFRVPESVIVEAVIRAKQPA